MMQAHHVRTDHEESAVVTNGGSAEHLSMGANCFVNNGTNRQRGGWRDARIRRQTRLRREADSDPNGADHEPGDLLYRAQSALAERGLG